MTDTIPTMVFFPCHRALAGAAMRPAAVAACAAPETSRPAGLHRGAPG